jgi:branched-chain amino acid transport system substrate-binding protein
MKYLIKLAALGASLAIAGGAQAADPVRIGAIVSQTGPGAFLGEPEAITLKHYVKKLNDAGGLLGRPVELTLYDDASDANTARTFATRLVEDDGVSAVIGTSTTGGTLAMTSVFEDAKIPLVSLAAGIQIVEPVKPYIFKTPHTDRMVCERIISEFTERGYDQVALMSGTDGVGKSIRKECIDEATKVGIEIVADETFNPKDVDMSPQLTKIKNTPGVDAVLVGGFGQPLAVVSRNYKHLGIELPQYQTHGAASKAYVEMSEGGAENVRLTGPLLVVADQLAEDDPLRPRAVEYAKTYRELTGQDVSTFGGYAYDALLLISDAITRANSDDPAAVRDALEATKDLPGVTGMFNMSPEDHLGITKDSLYMVTVKNGEWVLE